jgi:hypothetical protein
VGKTVAIVQSSYVPWKGYFDLIGLADAFVLFDEVQFTRRDWRSRNRIRTAEGTCWLTIPVAVRGRYTQRIDETRVASHDWAARHWRSIAASYRRAPHFAALAPALEALYASVEAEPLLSSINRVFVDHIMDLLGIDTPVTLSTEHPGTADDPTDRLIEICESLGADRYLSGPAAKAYLDTGRFEARGIEVAWMSYDGYPPYPQVQGGEFVSEVSILDLLLHVGPDDAPAYMQIGRSGLTRPGPGTAPPPGCS